VRHRHLHRANGRVASRLRVRRLACVAMAIVFYDNTYALFGRLAGHTLFYTSRYRQLVGFGRRQVRRVPQRAGPHHTWAQALSDPASRPAGIA